MSFFEFKNIYKSFNNELLLENVSFAFPSVGLVSLLGNSGEGKTTLFYILLGLESKDKGGIIYKNKELNSLNDYLILRSDSYFVFQEYGVLNYLNGIDNLTLGGYKIDYKNNIINENYLFKDCKYLSGGEKQRLAILKALKIKPKIIFCDEPTGALDEDNGHLIMSKLKELSKTSLVIMVSHNKALVNEYSDIILELKNKKLVLLKNKEELYLKKNNRVKQKRNIIKSLKIAFKSFMVDKLKLFLTSLSIILSLSSLLIVHNLNDFSSLTINNTVQTFFDYTRLKVSKIEESNLENSSFTISKIKRPSKRILKEVLNNEAQIEYNLDYFLSNASVSYKNEILNISLITYPYGSGLEDLRINKAASNIFFDLQEAISIDIKQNVYTEFNNELILDKITLNLEGYIHNVYEEFEFLNTPCIFISHDALKDYMKGTKLNNLSSKRKVYTSLYDRYEALSKDDEEYSSYSYYVDIYKKDNVINIYNKLKNIDDLSIENRSIMVRNTLTSSFDLINIVTSMFSIISLIITIFLLYQFNLNSFQKRKKEFMLYKTMGLNDLHIFILLFIPNYIFLIISYILSFPLYKVCGFILNKLLYPYLKCNILANINLSISTILLYVWLLLILAIIFAFSYLFLIKRIKVSEVIKSE